MVYRKKNSSKFRGAIVCGMILLAQCLMVLTAQAQDNLSQLRVMWRNSQYSEVIPLLIKYREGPYGRNAEVDYMIATSACRTTNLQQSGYKFFNWILSNYSLDPKDRKLVEKEMEQCTFGNQPIMIAYPTQRSGVGVRGKTFYWLDRKNAIFSNPVKVIKDIPPTEFAKRLFEPKDTENGIRYIRELLGPKSKVDSAGSFILASLSGHSQSELRGMGQRLEKVLRFFASQYKMPIPSYLLTIYLVPNSWELEKLAEKIHGIRVSEGSIGYSFQDDLTIVAMISPPDTYIGTPAHELFHLMSRKDFGDMPPWIDEGMAALYEVLQITGDTVVGRPNWRGDILKRFWTNRPPIDKLVKMDWNSFEVSEGDYEAVQQTTNHATARYFILYLQENNKLVEVYSAFRDRKVEEVQKDPGTDAVYRLESILQKPLAEVDKDFTRWFGHL